MIPGIAGPARSRPGRLAKFAPAAFAISAVIRFLMPIQDRQCVPTPVEEISFAFTSTAQYVRRLVAASAAIGFF